MAMLHEALLPELIADLQAQPSLLAALQRQARLSSLDSRSLARSLVAVAVAIVRRLAEGTDHGVHANAVEKMLRGLPVLSLIAKGGLEIWAEMKRKARRMWEPPAPVPCCSSALLRFSAVGRASNYIWLVTAQAASPSVKH